MSVPRLRATVAYLATAAFFAVGAAGQLQGQAIVATALKATVACIAIALLGSIVIGTVEATARRNARKRVPKDVTQEGADTALPTADAA